MYFCSQSKLPLGPGLPLQLPRGECLPPCSDDLPVYMGVSDNPPAARPVLSDVRSTVCCPSHPHRGS